MTDFVQQIIGGRENAPVEAAVLADVSTKEVPKTILELFDLLLPFFKEDADPRTWAAWRVFLAAAFGLPMPEVEYPGCADETVPRGAANLTKGMTSKEIYEACTGRTTYREKAFRRVALVVGRRGGKSFVSAVIGIFLACFKEYKLGIGETGMVAIAARDKDQARVIRNYIIALLKTAPLEGYLAGEPTQQQIELRNGIVIEVRAASFKGFRGYTIVAALLDEIAFWQAEENSANPDKAVIRAIRPSMSRVAGSMMVMLSSPYARKGVFYETYEANYGKDDASVLVWQADSLSMNPSDDEELLTEIRETYDEDPESASAEYGANFRSDLEVLFNHETLNENTSVGVKERTPEDGVSYRAFVDPAGGSGADSMTIAVGHTEEREGREVEVLDFVKEWKPKFSPDAVVEEIAVELQRWRIGTVTGDNYAAEWAKEPFKKRNIEYQASEKNRSQIYIAMLPLVNSGRVDLLDDKKMKNQLSSLQRRTGRGRDTVDHPKGQHDDVSNAAAGVLTINSGGRRYRVRSLRDTSNDVREVIT